MSNDELPPNMATPKDMPNDGATVDLKARCRNMYKLAYEQFLNLRILFADTGCPGTEPRPEDYALEQDEAYRVRKWCIDTVTPGQ